MRNAISNGQASTSLPASGYSPNPAGGQTNAKHRGSDPFSDVELGQTDAAQPRKSDNNNAYSDDPYAERGSDEVEEYEMEQQQVRHLAIANTPLLTFQSSVDNAAATGYCRLPHIEHLDDAGTTGGTDRSGSDGAE